MKRNRVALLVACCLVVTAGCLGPASQQEPTATETEPSFKTTPPREISAIVTIEESYPDPFTVIISEVSSGEEIINQTYPGDHNGTLEFHSKLPSGEAVHVKIISENGTLWEKRIGYYTWYRLEIHEDGSVDVSFTEA